MEIKILSFVDEVEAKSESENIRRPDIG